MDDENCVCVCTQILFSSKENIITKLAEELVDLEYIILSDITKSQKEKLHVLFCVWNRVNFVCAHARGEGGETETER